MRILNGLSEIEGIQNAVVTIGTFDGVHLGHHELIAYLASRSAHYGGHSVLITFEPHPRLVLGPAGGDFRILTTLAEKIAVLRTLNLDVLLVLPFTTIFSHMTGPEFIEGVLIDKLHPTEVVVGYDHAFGHKRSGTIETLQHYETGRAFALQIFQPFSIAGRHVKSTPIRQHLAQGDLITAKQLLGRDYELSGTVVAGAGRGRRLQFPTANLMPDNEHKLVPGDGIFAARVRVEDRWYGAAVSIGIRPTFGEKERTIEAYLLDFDRDIYGKQITIQFVQRLRDELEFESEKALIRQIHGDVAEVRKSLEQFEVISEE